MYSWQVKFNNEIIYYRHLTYYVDSVKPNAPINVKPQGGGGGGYPREIN